MVDGDNRVAWECPYGSGIRQFITQAQYDNASQRIKKFYTPYRCASCATTIDPLAAALALPEIKALVGACNPLLNMHMWTESAVGAEIVITSVGRVRAIRQALAALTKNEGQL